ncbi:hypothetical protein [Streptomyces sp. NPDC018031]|uniref:hypothetical protein n=1 Tax=Streptomyces sp. NPDC018031 TaxID=3365033 RepID=UPI0037A74A92
MRGRSIRIAVITVIAAASALVAPSVGAAQTPATGAERGGAGKGGAATERWEIARAGGLSPSAHLSSVASAGRDAAWAVGHESHDAVPVGVVLRWDGEEWRQEHDAGLPEVRYWQTVSAASPRDVWIYGWGESGEVTAHYDGKRWRRVDLPELPGGAIYGYSEIAAERGRTWLAGGRRISTWERDGWRTTELAAGQDVVQIDARSARDAWAVGGTYTGASGSRPLALHWNGHRWREVRLPDVPVRLTDVYAESARSVWVTGFASPIGEEGYEPRVLHWNGKKWKDVTGPVAGLSPEALSGDGRGRVWLGGDPAGWEGPPVLWRHERGRWTRVEGATVPGGMTQSYTVNGLAPIGHTGRHWAVGDYELLDGMGNSFPYEIIQRSRW